MSMSLGTALDIGAYTAPEASRLLKVPAKSIYRWLGGYQFHRPSGSRSMPPLWEPQLPKKDGHIEIGFRDLIELRFVDAFMKAGLGLLTIRNCLNHARECVNDPRPFSTRQFRTDGRTIFLESAKIGDEVELLDLKSNQYMIKQTIERTFKDLDLDSDVVARWRPYRGKQSIVIDPRRSFGQPIAEQYGIPTATLAEAVVAEGSVEKAAMAYEVSASVIRDAVAFERSLHAAA